MQTVGSERNVGIWWVIIQIFPFHQINVYIKLFEFDTIIISRSEYELKLFE